MARRALKSAPMTKAALITGGGVRVGAAIARRLAADGWAVALHYRASAQAAQAQAAEIMAAGGRACTVQADLADWDACFGLVDAAAAGLGQPLTGLVNCASLFEGDAAQDFTQASWAMHMDANLRAPCLLAQRFAAALPDGAEGAVVNIIDQRVWKLTPQFFTYTLSKAALFTATKTLAQALAPRVRVNGVAPGPTLRNARQSEEDFARQAEATILGRGGSADEVADAVAWLLQARAVTGQMIAADGGQHLVWRTPDVDGIVE